MLNGFFALPLMISFIVFPLGQEAEKSEDFKLGNLKRVHLVQSVIVSNEETTTLRRRVLNLRLEYEHAYVGYQKIYQTYEPSVPLTSLFLELRTKFGKIDDYSKLPDTVTVSKVGFRLCELSTNLPF